MALEEDSNGHHGFWGFFLRTKKRDPECPNLLTILQRFRSFFAGADINCIADFIDKDFTVTR